jgi:peptidyl-prolyl cis-trans isomerase D
MVEANEGFIVAVLADIELPDPKADPIGYDKVKQSLARALAQDIEAVYATAVRDRANPHVSEAAVASLTASPGE